MSWADRSLGYVQYLDSIDRVLPNPKYLMIHRHGLGVTHSITANGQEQPHHVLKQAAQTAGPAVSRLNHEVETPRPAAEQPRPGVRPTLRERPSVLNFTGVQGR